MIRELEEGSMVEHNLGNQAWSALVGTWKAMAMANHSASHLPGKTTASQL